MKSLSLSSTVLVSTLVAVAYIQQALGTPVNFERARANDDVSDRWVTLPVGIEGKLHPGLTVTKAIGYGIGSAMGVATYNNQERFIKCSYFGMGRGEAKILKAIAEARKTNPQDGQYFVDHIKTFDTGLPHATSESVKSVRPGFLPKTIPFIKFGRCMVMEYAGDVSLDKFVETLNANNRDRIIYDIAIQLLKAHRLLHKNKIIYNNMKSSDIIVTQDANGNPRIKLIDFDMSVMFRGGMPLVGKVMNQDVDSLPPEFGNWRWTSMRRADTWYIGARLFQLITGKSVLDATLNAHGHNYASRTQPLGFDIERYKKDYISGKLTPPPVTKYGNDDGAVAPYLTDLLKVLLAPKVADRPTAEEYLNRPADMRHPAQMQLVVRPRN
ncbi:kinase-like domain-containing protein [Syncephalis plumigaleata]|nr:kinase-like domain-containing protein [Syncephalis plumigaleata]KAI8055967.1 kinase-like domain-containing protein [Syncephalis plumigaleata]